MSTIVKAVLILICGILFGAAVTPPQPAAKGAVTVYKGQPLEHIIRSFSYFVRTVLAAAFICFATATIILASNARLQAYLPYVCPTANTADTAMLTTYHLRFLTGVICVVIGSTLRLWSFRTLGKLFTFEVVITDGHRLINAGPYAHVRHPAYIGMIVMTLGVHLVQFGAGGYVTECRLANSPAAVFVYMWWVGSPFVVVSLLRRCIVEDAQLRKHFGGDWEQYRKEVPYRLLPHVY